MAYQFIEICEASVIRNIIKGTIYFKARFSGLFPLCLYIFLFLCKRLTFPFSGFSCFLTAMPQLCSSHGYLLKPSIGHVSVVYYVLLLVVLLEMVKFLQVILEMTEPESVLMVHHPSLIPILLVWSCPLHMNLKALL
jgi:hypothetical protein